MIKDLIKKWWAILVALILAAAMIVSQHFVEDSTQIVNALSALNLINIFIFANYNNKRQKKCENEEN